MALLAAIFDKPKRLQLNAPNGDGTERELLIMDLTNNISHVNESSPTENPVESGGIITDHVDILPKILSFEGKISSSPISLGQAAVGNVAGAVPAIGGIGNTLGGTLATGALATLGGILMNSGATRVEDAMNTMLEIMESVIPVTIITGLRSYNNMILKSFQPIENTQTGNDLSFTATFKEIIIVKSEQIILPASVLAAGVQNKATTKEDTGKKTAEESTKGVSLLSRLTGIGG